MFRVKIDVPNSTLRSLGLIHSTIRLENFKICNYQKEEGEEDY